MEYSEQLCSKVPLSEAVRHQTCFSHRIAISPQANQKQENHTGLALSTPSPKKLKHCDTVKLFVPQIGILLHPTFQKAPAMRKATIHFFTSSYLSVSMQRHSTLIT